MKIFRDSDLFSENFFCCSMNFGKWFLKEGETGRDRNHSEQLSSHEGLPLWKILHPALTTFVLKFNSDSR